MAVCYIGLYIVKFYVNLLKLGEVSALTYALK